MGSGIYIATSGAESQQDALDVTANNIANASTTGYKAMRVSFSTALSNAQSADSAFVGAQTKGNDNTDGSLIQTDNPLDLALVGDGFFTVQTGNGPRYTRAGSFRLDAARQLVNSDGHPALSPTGQPIAMPEGATSLSVDARGQIVADGEVVGQLALARFADGGLRREGASLFSATGRPLEGEGPEVVSGALESSNVNIVRGVVDLVKVSRTYESLMRMIDGYREIEGRAARDIGRPR
jgi:flagellar basal-body rod protein FlgF